jgi:hypothetical protein
MSLPENPAGGTPLQPTEDAGPGAVDHLQTELRALRSLFNIVMVVMIILVASLFTFMLREMKMARRQIQDNSRFVSEYKRQMEPRLNELQSKLFAYSKLHTNFAPIFTKYFGATNVSAGLSGGTSDLPADPTTGVGTVP